MYIGFFHWSILIQQFLEYVSRNTGVDTLYRQVDQLILLVQLQTSVYQSIITQIIGYYIFLVDVKYLTKIATLFILQLQRLLSRTFFFTHRFYFVTINQPLSHIFPFVYFQKQRMTTRMEEIDGRPAQFGCTVDDLQQLMENRGHDGYQMIQQQYGGVLEICKRLYTSPNEGMLVTSWCVVYWKY